MTQMILIPFHQHQHHLGYKKVRFFTLLQFCDNSFSLLGQVGPCSRPVRATAGTRLAEAIAAEKLDTIRILMLVKKRLHTRC